MYILAIPMEVNLMGGSGDNGGIMRSLSKKKVRGRHFLQETQTYLVTSDGKKQHISSETKIQKVRSRKTDLSVIIDFQVKSGAISAELGRELKKLINRAKRVGGISVITASPEH